MIGQVTELDIVPGRNPAVGASRGGSNPPLPTIAVLWACRRRIPIDGTQLFCAGFKYLEPDEDPGICGHESLFHTEFGQPPTIRTCGQPMDMIGEFELEVV